MRWLGGAIVTFENNPPTLRCYGDEDRSTQSLRRQALSKALCAPEDVMVDLADLAFADPSLMLDLAMIARRLRKSGRELTLSGAQPHIAVLIEYVGLHRLPGVAIAPAPTPA
jgi:anti-anti-sigma regulatory factor